MAANDWVCSACRAQNRAGDSACRVCDAARARAAAKAGASAPAKTSAKAAPAPIVTPAHVRLTLLVLGVLWYAAWALTGLLWLTGLTLPALVQQPAALPAALQQFRPGTYGQALQLIGSELAAAPLSLSGPGLVWQYGLATLHAAAVSPIALQGSVLTLLWALRLTVASLAEAHGLIRSRRNLMGFTILPADFLLAALALVPHADVPWLALRVHLLSLLTPQLVAVTAVSGLLLLTGACSRRPVTRCLLKCAATAGLIWLCAALLPIT